MPTQEKIEQKRKRKIEVERLLKEGHTQTQIARMYGLSVSSISLYARELDIPGNTDWYKSRNAILDLHRSGMRQVEIARKMHLSRQRVSEIIKKFA